MNRYTKQNSSSTLNELWKDKVMKNVLSKNQTEERNCLFIRKTNCSILKKKECKNCKFYVENTPDNYQKYIEDVKKDIKNYALNHN